MSNDNSTLSLTYVISYVGYIVKGTNGTGVFVLRGWKPINLYIVSIQILVQNRIFFVSIKYCAVVMSETKWRPLRAHFKNQSVV